MRQLDGDEILHHGGQLLLPLHSNFNHQAKRLFMMQKPNRKSRRISVADRAGVQSSVTDRAIVLLASGLNRYDKRGLGTHTCAWLLFVLIAASATWLHAQQAVVVESVPGDQSQAVLAAPQDGAPVVMPATPGEAGPPGS